MDMYTCWHDTVPLSNITAVDLTLQEMTEKIEQHKEIIDSNNKTFYEMKKQKDALQNERKWVTNNECS